MKRIFKQFSSGQNGTTRKGLVIVAGLLGIILTVVISGASKFDSAVKPEPYTVELNNIETAMKTMLEESSTHSLVPVTNPTNNMGAVMTTDTPPLVLTSYMADLNGNLTVTGYKYTFTATGLVKQTPPS